MVKFPRTPGIPALLWIAALASSAVVLWQHAVPVLDQQAFPDHKGHLTILVMHVVGGLAMLVFGAAGLYVGWTRKGFRYHRAIGYSYLALGSMGAVTALILSVKAPHRPHSLYVATGTLALVWIAVAAMAWRAARYRRMDMHRQWMIRSYVLSWTFVGCRRRSRSRFSPCWVRKVSRPRYGSTGLSR